MRHAFLQERGRLMRIGPIAIADEEIAEGLEVPRDVTPRRLHLPLHRDPEVVVLDIEEHRELQRRRHGEGRPEAIGRDRPIPTEGDADRAGPPGILERIAMVGDRLGPPRGRGVLGADITGHGEDHRARAIREVTDDTDVATIGETAGPSKRGAQGVVEGEAEGEEEGAAPIVGAGRIALSGQEGPQDALRHIMPARGELVEDQMVLGHRGAVAVGRLLEVIHRAGGEHVVGDATPVEAGEGTLGHGGNLMGIFGIWRPP